MNEFAQLLIFTDLDGTLLEEHSYSHAPAQPALGRLRERAIPVIFCTSKTYEETLHFQKLIHIQDPFIVENGGAIYFPPQTPLTSFLEKGKEGWVRIPLGVPYPDLLKHIQRIKRLIHCPLVGFHDMEPEDIALECTLTLAEARRAQEREFDEPFHLLDPYERDIELIADYAQENGLTFHRGGRFFHLTGGCDKGRAIQHLCDLWRKHLGEIRTVGLGDSPNDLPMLKAVDCPILVQRPGGYYERELLEAVPEALRADGVGPEGWNRAVLERLDPSRKP